MHAAFGVDDKFGQQRFDSIFSKTGLILKSKLILKVGLNPKSNFILKLHVGFILKSNLILKLGFILNSVCIQNFELILLCESI